MGKNNNLVNGNEKNGDERFITITELITSIVET